MEISPAYSSAFQKHFDVFESTRSEHLFLWRNLEYMHDCSSPYTEETSDFVRVDWLKCIY